MRPLFISRKGHNGYGGLSRFYMELSTHFPEKHYDLSPSSLQTLASLVFQKPSHIYLCDATLLPLGVLLKKLWKKPLIVSAHGLDLTFPFSPYQAMLKYLLPQTDAVILDSKPSEKLLMPFGLKTPTRVIPLGVSKDHLKQTNKVSLPTKPNTIVMTTVGNLVKRKGHEWFISRVLPFLPKNFVYCIVGEGPEKAAMKQTIKQLKLEKRVFLLGRRSHQELSYILKHTDIYLSPNQHIKDNFESFGIAALEAAAIGIPVIASNVDGISQAIHHRKNGLIVPPTPQVFADTIKLFANPSKRQQFGKKAQQYTLQNFSWDKTAKEYAKVFANIKSF